MYNYIYLSIYLYIYINMYISCLYDHPGSSNFINLTVDPFQKTFTALGLFNHGPAGVASRLGTLKMVRTLKSRCKLLLKV